MLTSDELMDLFRNANANQKLTVLSGEITMPIATIINTAVYIRTMLLAERDSENLPSDVMTKLEEIAQSAYYLEDVLYAVLRVETGAPILTVKHYTALMRDALSVECGELPLDFPFWIDQAEAAGNRLGESVYPFRSLDKVGMSVCVNTIKGCTSVMKYVLSTQIDGKVPADLPEWVDHMSSAADKLNELIYDPRNDFPRE